MVAEQQVRIDFALAGGERRGPRVAARQLVERGGIVVMDDFTPCDTWPPLTLGRVDTLREAWLTDDRFTAVEVMVAPDTSALIATKN